MPQLPDLTAKLKVDFPNVAAATAQAALLGQALQRELGGTRGTEIDRSMKQIGNAVEEAGVKVANAGTAYVKWGDTVKTSTLRISSDTAKTKADFDELEKRTKVLGATLESEFKKGSTAVVKLAADGTASLGNVSRSMSATAAGGAGLGGVFSAIGAAAASAAVPALISLGGALSPILVLVGALVVALAAALVATVAFAAGIAAVATVIAVALGGIGALAAGIVALAVATQGWTATTQTVPQAQAAVQGAVLAHEAAVQKLAATQKAYSATSTHTAAQTLALQQAQLAVSDSAAKLTAAQDKLTAAEKGADNPLQTLLTSLKEMANVLGTQAAPMAALFLSYLNSLVPGITSMGQQLLTWFGSRIPEIMTIASAAIDSVLVTIGELGAIWGQVIDYFILGQSRLLPIFGALLDFGVGAIQGLVTNLLNLSDWFLDRLPLFQPVISTIFGGLGTAIQAIIGWFGRLTDWVLANWPAIISTIQSLWDNIVQGWATVHPLLDAFMQGWRAMAPVLDYIKAHAEELKPVLVLVGIEVGLLAFAFLGLVAAGVLVVAGMVAVGQFVRYLTDQFKRDMPAMGAEFSAWGGAAHAAGQIIGAVFSAIGGALHQLMLTNQRELGLIGDQFRGLVQWGRSMQSDLGAVFGAIRSGAQGMADAVGTAVDGLAGRIHTGLDSARGVFNSFANKVNDVLGNFKITIPTIHPFAQGGVVPGYAPGQDSVLAALSPGEGVLTPQTVRGLGGSGAIDALNGAHGRIHGMGAALLDNIGSLGSIIGSIAGQCVVAVERWTGRYFPVQMASQMTAWINSRLPAPGEIFVSTIPPFGHTGLVIGPNQVIDSNWGLDERVRIHALSDIPNIAGYIAGSGTNLGALGFALPSLGEILKGLIAPLTAVAHASANAIPDQWARPLANSLIDQLVSNIAGRASGGPVLPGHLYTVGENGPELFASSTPGVIYPGAAGSSTVRVEGLLGEAVRLLHEINGTPSLDADSASRRYAQ